MKKIVLSCLILVTSLVLAPQTKKHPTINQNETKRTVSYEENTLVVEYIFPNYASYTESALQINFAGFGFEEKAGKPRVPGHTDFIALPLEGSYSFRIFENDSIILENRNIPISNGPQCTTEQVINYDVKQEFQCQDEFFPSGSARLTKISYFRGHPMAQIRINPVRYNPHTKELIYYRKIKYSITFDKTARFVDKNETSLFFSNLYPNIVLNNFMIKCRSKTYLDTDQDTSKDYIIITTNEYKKAAIKLANLKRQLGYTVRLEARDIWTPQKVFSFVSDRYLWWTTKPSYLLILGDHNDVPGDSLSANYFPDFLSDLYYVCMDGPDDIFPDISRGRIPVSSLEEALAVIDKIEEYEFFPSMDSSFYKKSLYVTHFEDNDFNTYADYRHAQSTEELVGYMRDENDHTISRAYYTESVVNPLFWNENYFSSGEPIPDEIKKPGFAWNGSSYDINLAINDGVNFVLAITYGAEDMWQEPYYTTYDIPELTNHHNYPIIFSLSYLTGNFGVSNCLCEAFLKKSESGAIAAYGPTSYGYNLFAECLGMGMIDAIWSDPGFIPDFTGIYGNQNPSCIPHDDILCAGDVLIQGIVRMAELFEENKYMNEIYHYFGDPAMQFRSIYPTKIMANNDPFIVPGPGSYNISSCNAEGATTTLVCNGKLIGKATIDNGSCDISYAPFEKDTVLLTISKSNFIPYIDTLINTSVNIRSLNNNSSGNSTMLVRPNPASQNLIVESDNKGILSIYNLKGERIILTRIDNKLWINVSDLENGMYVIQLDSGVRRISQKLIIIN